MNELLKVLGIGGQKKPASPATGGSKTEPTYNPWLHNADAWEQGQRIRETQKTTESMNGIKAALAGGDYEGAKKAALGAGSFDTAKSIDEMIASMNKRQLEETARKAKIGASVLQPLLGVSEAERDQYRPQIEARLRAQGYTDADLAGLDLSTVGIEQDLNLALGLEKRMEGRTMTEMGDNLVLSDTATGTAGSIYSRPPTYSEVTTREENERPDLPEGMWQNPETGKIEPVPGYEGMKSRIAAAGRPAGGGSGELGLSPIYGRDANGNRVVFQPSKSGGLVQSQVPEGITLEDDRYKAAGRTQGTELAKAQVYQTQAGQAVLAAEESFNRLASQIDQAIQVSNSNNTGMIMGRAPAPNLEALIDTITANTAFDTLVNLKAQGGTLGALSDAELTLLKAKVANLARSQSEDQFDANLEILKITFANSMARIKAAYEQEYAAGRFEGLPQIGGGGQGGVPPMLARPGAGGAGSSDLPPGFVIIE